ncbi:uncharacterized protein DSM5745_07582 [Aspergillus mulundensis]|uniref:Heterokaryon incompatibility domain-containing protein n=1 Tax=Aspergillus mulundensis TaxID=1810919 RepID=A0A3D8REJ9_9EURO|nr:hypothetical protein DSM5745_07582 [Aspergillus mulundensis]RDW72410.1 hypothetical protein DSM5745_07582 [Aspergillus mulundensis]
MSTPTTSPLPTANPAATRAEIRTILTTNNVGPSRALQASLNEFRGWPPSSVSSLFTNFPPLPDRRLYPLGPECRYPPPGRRRWTELAAKVATLAIVDTVALATAPITLATMDAAARANAAGQLRDVHVEMLATSLFVAPSLGLMEEAGRRGLALCVNRSGQFQIMGSGYAAISHVWAETMGLQFNDEKIEQDERGLLRSHFNKIMGVVGRAGYEWVWFDLLAIPKKGHGQRQDKMTEIKTLIINSLHGVYSNADAVIVLDSFPLLLPSSDPLLTAAVLVCGLWLTRVWTYQEIKLARKALIITATAVVPFSDILSTLETLANGDRDNRYYQLYRTFARLQPVYGLGINLADIALSCSNRSTGNDVDYARGFYALLGLKWESGWSYEDGIRHIYEARPQEAAMIASMHGPRGLPRPLTWAPRYLAHLQGEAFKPYLMKCQSGGLVGEWHAASVREVVRVCAYEQPGKDDRLAFQLLVANERGDTAQVAVVTWTDRWTASLKEWTGLIPGGKARLLCAKEMVVGEHFPTVLLAVLEGDMKPNPDDVVRPGVDSMGYVLASGVVVSGNLLCAAQSWLLK